MDHLYQSLLTRMNSDVGAVVMEAEENCFDHMKPIEQALPRQCPHHLQ